ncbi:MAG: HNH endonuclease signature motif containing protein [Chloroflexota bacterium]|nr:HNH endonuclease signature motif containing protein [Chloroflexota bacterium]MDE2856743.1 HNH endonuclease signature motif containing protein [Chloroflexota bacterium]
MAWIPARLRQQVNERARGQCEYCQTQESITIEMVIDHIIPLTRKGETSLSNLSLSCVGCNMFKRDFVAAIDPETGAETTLFNPRIQNWNDHFSWDDEKTRLVGLTAVGRATVSRLRMNRRGAVRARQRWVDAGLHPPIHGS